MISRFFIERPVLSNVLALVFVLIGLVSLIRLPVSQYPNIVPPTVSVTTSYPGASAKTMIDTVALPIEQQVNGVEGMIYMQSWSASDGTYTLVVSFAIGTDPNMAQVLVQNRVNIALASLPTAVQAQGVTILQKGTSILEFVTLTSPTGKYDGLFLNNYAIINVQNELERVEGVANVAVFGAGTYALRVWMDPDRMQAFGLTPTDISNAIQKQSQLVTPGQLGIPPAPSNASFQYTVNVSGRLDDVKDYENIIVKVDNSDGGRIVRIRDIGRVELGAQSYSKDFMQDNKPAAGIGIFQLPAANALDVAKRVAAKMEELKKNFPEGLDYAIPFDTTLFVTASIDEVWKTLFEAAILVLVVILLFLQDWRATLVPATTVPVTIIGAFAAMDAMGFTINLSTLFAIILAIGIVVDDAIVVVENVERNIEAGLTPREATYRAMREVSGPIIAIALTLVAVFVPLAFMTGLTGQFYKQFAMTIAISTVISAFNSLTLSPALAAMLLKGHGSEPDWLTRQMNRYLGGFFAGFNRFFRRASDNYGRGVTGVLARKASAMGVYAVLLGLTVGLSYLVPGGFVPAQDKQYLIGFAQLPNGASLDRTEAVIRQMGEIALAQPGVQSAIAFPGLSINGFTNSSSAGIVFATLKPFDERRGKELSAEAIAGALNQKYAAIQEAFIAVFPPPPVMGLGTLGGFKLQIEDRGALGYAELDRAAKAFMAAASKAPELGPMFSSYQINVPQLDVDLDRTKAKQQGVSVTDVFDTMQIYLGSLYVNDFNRFGRVYQVRAQADAPFRSRPEDILQLKTRNNQGEMVPLSSLVKVSTGFGPEMVVRYNGYTAADINGGPAPGFSSAQAEAAVERVAAETLPRGVKFEWTDLTYQKILAGNAGIWVFPISLLLVFLVLAAQYESLTLPLAVILIVPMSILAALTGVWLTGGDNNIFTQIGLMVLVGLACKNAILIVEFARELELQGSTPLRAAIDASRLRLRPILMTSIAFVMGVVPLVLSSGAGSEMRHAMGIAVFFGMLGVTFFGLFLTPAFYVLLRTLDKRHKLHSAAHHEAPITAVPSLEQPR